MIKEPQVRTIQRIMYFPHELNNLHGWKLIQHQKAVKDLLIKGYDMFQYYVGTSINSTEYEMMHNTSHSTHNLAV